MSAADAVTARHAPVPRRAGWWRGRSEVGRVELYTRWSLYALSATEPLVVASLLSRDDEHLRTAGLVAAALAVAHTAACLALCRAGVDARLHRRGTPRAALATAVAGGLALAATTAAFAAPLGAPGGGSSSGVLVLLAAVTYTAAAATTVAPPRRTAPPALAVVLVVGALLLTQGAGTAAAPWVGAARWVVGAGAVVLASVEAYRFSLWLLGVVQQLEDAQEARAALAVAEERLRFSRDLHDVVGRHLSAIAVKSELVAELARRDRDATVGQALEVRSLAHESLREVRDVVRGYRAVDLDAELAGSRALLRAAGVRCRTTGDAGGWPPTVQEALAWGVREGATNVLRHSAATTCTLALVTGEEGTARLVVMNDGVPADGASGAGGSGLAGLAERLAPLGGSVTAVREEPDRFVLRLDVPLPGAPGAVAR